MWIRRFQSTRRIGASLTRAPERSFSSQTGLGNDGVGSLHGTIPHEPVPGRDSPLHRASNDPRNHLHVYEGLRIPLPMNPRLESRNTASLELHTQGQVTASYMHLGKHFGTLFSHHGNLSEACDAYSSFYNLFQVANASLRISSRIHSSVVRVTAANDPPQTTPTRSKTRSWHLKCSLAKSNDSCQQLSRPYFTFRGSRILLSQVFKFRYSEQLPERTYALRWSLEGHLKPDVAIQSESVKEQRSTIGLHFQHLADSMVDHIFASANEREVSSLPEMFSAIREPLLAFLPTSGFPRILDMSQVRLRFDTGTTYVDSIHLNADGTPWTQSHDGQPSPDVKFLPELERYSALDAPEDPTVAFVDAGSELERQAVDSDTIQKSSTPLNGDGAGDHCQINEVETRAFSGKDNEALEQVGSPTGAIDMPSAAIEKFTSQGFWFNPSVRYKLGVKGPLEYLFFRDGRDLKRSPDIKPIIEEFGQRCADSDRRGLSCFLTAFVQTVGNLPDGLQLKGLEMKRAVNIQSLQEPGIGPWFRFWIYRDENTGIHSLSFILSWQEDMPCRINAVADRESKISHCRLVLKGVIDQHMLKSAGPRKGEDIPAQDEAAYLMDIASMFLERYCKSMTFDSRGSAVSILAEDMLRVLHFRTPSLRLASLSLKLDFDEGSSDSRERHEALAKWKEDRRAVHDDASESEVEVILENGNGVAEEEDASDEQPPSVPMQSSSSGVETTRPRATAAGKSISEHLREDSNTTITLQNHFVQFPPAIVNKTGVRGCKIAMVWPSKHKQALAHHTLDGISGSVQRAIESAAGTGLHALSQATQILSDTAPLGPSTTLSFQHPSGKHRGASGASLDVVVRADTINAHKRSMFMNIPGSRWHDFKIANIRGGRADSITMHYRLEKCSLTDIEAGEEDCLSSADRIREAIEPSLQPLIENVFSQSLESVAAECAATVARMPRPLAGLISFEGVEITVHALTNGVSVDRAKVRQSAVCKDDSQHPSKNEWPVFVALGSNVGDRFGAIEDACKSMDESGEMRVVATSPLYETEPMYVEDQDRFVNGVCQIETQLQPVELLDKLQGIENGLGRVKMIDKGPRNIDLDIVTYKEQQVDTERLTIPHRLMLEREFVLRPLCDIAAKSYTHPETGLEPKKHLLRLPRSATPMYPLTPLAPGCEPVRSLDPRRRTIIMSILNVTPDSFSDGGINQPADMDALKKTVASHIAAGATIIDIGGQSSRPNAPDVTAEEELSRILPAIEAIRSLPEATNIAISIDTYRASVAEAAINAGAHIINDISAGLLDSEMLPTIARLGCTYIMMHMRGTPHTMQSEENTSYPDGVIPTVASELHSRLAAAREAGIRRWRIILDPGVGFAKTVEQNLEILRELERLRNRFGLKTYPWLVGSSRKGFIGKITGATDARDRMEGTAATVTAAIQGGAEIVRVHDVEEMGRVVKMADAMYRSSAVEGVEGKKGDDVEEKDESKHGEEGK